MNNRTKELVADRKHAAYFYAAGYFDAAGSMPDRASEFAEYASLEAIDYYAGRTWHLTSVTDQFRAWLESDTNGDGPTPAASNPTERATTPTATCRECGRTFDLANHSDAAEWSYGHDCEG